MTHTVKLFNYLQIFCLVGLAMLAGCGQEPAAPAGSDIAAAELNARINAGTAPLILDVRAPDEFAAGHLPGAINIAHSVFVESSSAAFSQLPADKNTEIVVHCLSGRRAAIATTALQDAGYNNVRHLAGDYAGWQGAGLPLTGSR